MASNLHFSLQLISLFIFFHLSYSRFYLNADEALIQSVCKESTDKPFCLQAFRSDPRTAAANLDGLCLISLSQIIDHVTRTSDKIPGLLDQATDPTMKKRLQFCQQNYNDCVSKYRQAYTFAEAKAYRDVLNQVDLGFSNATMCQAEFRRQSPIQDSPFTGDTNLLLRLDELPGLVINHLL